MVPSGKTRTGTVSWKGGTTNRTVRKEGHGPARCEKERTEREKETNTMQVTARAPHRPCLVSVVLAFRRLSSPWRQDNRGRCGVSASCRAEIAQMETSVSFSLRPLVTRRCAGVLLLTRSLVLSLSLTLFLSFFSFSLSLSRSTHPATLLPYLSPALLLTSVSRAADSTTVYRQRWRLWFRSLTSYGILYVSLFNRIEHRLWVLSRLSLVRLSFRASFQVLRNTVRFVQVTRFLRAIIRKFASTDRHYVRYRCTLTVHYGVLGRCTSK